MRLIVLGLALFVSRPAFSQPASRADLEAFLDGVIASQMRSHQIASVTLSVVKDGELFFAKGYGYADREARLPVDAERTLFRPGSISKLFTWTAVMQLVERGKIDLDADVNQYLSDFQIPDTFPEPITYRVSWFETQGFTLTIVIAAILLSFTAISGGIRHRWENRNEPAPGIWTARVAAVMGLLTLAFLGSAAAIVMATGEEIFYGIPESLTAALVLPHVTAVLLAALAVVLSIVWMRRLFPWRRRIHYTLFFLAAAGLHWIYLHWNVLGFRY
jgi:hypothetical protein